MTKNKLLFPGREDTLYVENHTFGIVLHWDNCYSAETLDIYRQSGNMKKCIATVSKNTSWYVDTEVQNNCWGKVYSYYVLPRYVEEHQPILSYSWIQRLSPIQISNVEEKEGGEIIVALNTDTEQNKAAGYEIWFAALPQSFTEDIGWEKIIVEGRSVNTIKLSNLDEKTTYYIKVRAYADYTHQGKGITKRSWSAYSQTITYSTKAKRSMFRFLK